MKVTVQAGLRRVCSSEAKVFIALTVRKLSLLNDMVSEME